MESSPNTPRLEHQIDKLRFETEAICADTGYDSNEVYNAMLHRKIKTFIPERCRSEVANYEVEFDPRFFIYLEEQDEYICPAGKVLRFSNYSKKNRRKRYLAKSKDCHNCPFREKCLGKSKNARMIGRSLHEDARAIQTANINTPEYHNAMRLRQIWCEGNFAHQKEQHNLRRTFKRGIEKITEQCLFSACALNLKRLVKAM